MRRLPPLTAMEAFVAVARLGSLKAAAEVLALSSPALSRRIQTLEQFVGRPLFERRHQAVMLNAEGKRLLAEAAPSLDALSLAIERAAGESDLMRLRLGVLPLFASQRLMPHLPDLRQRHPDLHIDIDTGAHGMSRVHDDLDVAIGLAKEADPGLYSRRIDCSRISAIGSKAHSRRLRRPEDLRGETILLHRDLPDTFHHWRQGIGMPDLEPAAVDHFDSGPLMLDAAAQGLGVAFMLDSHLAEANDDRLVQLFGVSVESPYSYWFACRPRALDRRPVRLFHDWLFERVGAPAA